MQPLDSAAESKVETLFQMNSHSILNLRALGLIECGDRSKEDGADEFDMFTLLSSSVSLALA
ncbi:MAG: hypothetical protein RMZ43_033165 [Nostoc sp. CmiVER01]|uniref:hypothetical protein n=1 Tax=Nostoc sp. CmiVER01 TaxID=3075384 RepID=UPI002AD4E653|nr:hypothetical protein [Nostoc sp. CmiVER01]MDZ8126587.1 hypothetical protein [Nostoc sp. CmiVER01]